MSIFISIFLIVIVTTVSLYLIRLNSQLRKINSRFEKTKNNTYTTTDYTDDDYYTHIDDLDFNTVMNKVTKDFTLSPYKDKFFFNDDIILGYRFENGKIMKIETLKNVFVTLHYDNNVIQLNQKQLDDAIAYFNEISPYAKTRYSKKRKTTTNYTDEQLKYQTKFRKLKSNHDARMRQINTMNKNDMNRTSLINEVNTVKRKMKSIFDKTGLEIKKTK